MRYLIISILLTLSMLNGTAQPVAISKMQAQSDIDTLFYTISEVHPNMFSVCSQGELFQAVNKVKKALPDSLTDVELYKRIAPLVTMIGDGHTTIWFPYNSYFTKDLQRMPLVMKATPDYRLFVERCIDNTIPFGSEILNINGFSNKQIIEAMLPYACGEKDFYRIERINNDMVALHELLFKTNEYNVSYRLKEDEMAQSITLQTATYEQIKQRMPLRNQQKSNQPYSFTISEDSSYAVMEFKRFYDPNRMKVFADSMFAELRAKNVTKLIIDVRDNGGGNSRVGDVLLRYISPRPFTQMGRTLIRVSPMTRRLTQIPNNIFDGWFYDDEGNMIQPLTAEQGHYDGKVILLVSHHTFSSASSFSWAFQLFGMGTVIGEETGGMNVSFGDVVYSKLPHSKLQYGISFKRFWLYGADESKIHGTIPDVEVPSVDALKEAILYSPNRVR